MRALAWESCNKNPSIPGSMVGPLIFGNSHIDASPIRCAYEEVQGGRTYGGTQQIDIDQKEA